MPTFKDINKKPLPKVKTECNVVKHKYRAMDLPDIVLEELLVVKNGTYYAPEGKAYDVVKVQVQQQVLPTVSVSTIPTKTVYNKEVDTLSEIIIVGNVTKGSDNISSISFTVDGTVVSTLTEDVSSGGIFSYTVQFESPVNSDFTVGVIAEDINNRTVEEEKDIKFVCKTYWGIVDDTISAPTESDIKGLANYQVIGSKDNVYSGINTEYGKIVYAYPSSFGSLTSIVDLKTGYEYIDSFTKTSVEVNGYAYFCYTLTDSAAATNMQLSFA